MKYRELATIYENIMLLEFSEGAIKKLILKFANDASEEEIRRELDDFEKYKNSIQKKDPFQYNTWIEFTEAIHAAKGKSEFKKGGTTNSNNITSTDDIIADDENVTIYKGDSQDKCVMYGKGYTFCISRPSGGNMFSNYRLSKESTFYFIYFKKKSKTDKDHIMVLDHTKNGYEWTFANNDTKKVVGGWDEIESKYPELKKYKDILVNKQLTDEERDFVNRLRGFSRKPTLEIFNTFSYKEQSQALKSTVNLPDDIWETLDSTLRNEFISTGPNLTDNQANDLKPNEISRYKKTRELSFREMIGAGLAKINKYDSYNVKSYVFEDGYGLGLLDIPDNIMQEILSDAEYAYAYAENALRWDNIPDNIMQGLQKAITSEADTAYRYAERVLRWRDVPDNIIQAIVSSPMFAYEYAANVLRWRDVPDNIIQTIASEADTAYRYAANVLKGQNVPDKIIQRIASKPFFAYEYAEEVLRWRNVPEIITRAIENDSTYAKKKLTENVTIEEGFFVSFNQLIERASFIG